MELQGGRGEKSETTRTSCGQSSTSPATTNAWSTPAVRVSAGPVSMTLSAVPAAAEWPARAHRPLRRCSLVRGRHDTRGDGGGVRAPARRFAVTGKEGERVGGPGAGVSCGWQATPCGPTGEGGPPRRDAIAVVPAIAAFVAGNVFFQALPAFP